MNKHFYAQTIRWTGNKGMGTKNYTAYDRNFDIEADGKPTIHGSSDPAFRGDMSKYNPEELFLASVSSCHMLWYLHLCAQASITVTTYEDHAQGEMTETKEGSGQFSEITLNPKVTITNPDQIEKAMELHHQANTFCFIARSLNFPIKHAPIVITG